MRELERIRSKYLGVTSDGATSDAPPGAPAPRAPAAAAGAAATAAAAAAADARGTGGLSTLCSSDGGGGGGGLASLHAFDTLEESGGPSLVAGSGGSALGRGREFAPWGLPAIEDGEETDGAGGVAAAALPPGALLRLPRPPAGVGSAAGAGGLAPSPPIGGWDDTLCSSGGPGTSVDVMPAPPGATPAPLAAAGGAAPPGAGAVFGPPLFGSSAGGGVVPDVVPLPAALRGARRTAPRPAGPPPLPLPPPPRARAPQGG